MRLFRILVLAATFGLALVPAASALRFTDESYQVPVGVVGEEYRHWFEGDGGCGPALPYHFRVLSGALPPGLYLGDDGLLSGIPTQAGSWSFWLELSDEIPPPDPTCVPRRSERLFTVEVVAGIVITTESAPPATVGSAYTLALTAEGGIGRRTWSIVSGELPPGLTLDSTTGAITGSPATAGVYEFRVRASDDERRTSKLFSIAVREPLAVRAPTVPPAEVGAPIDRLKFVATGGSRTKTWRLDGTLPRGLVFDGASGAITGTPQAAGTFPVQVVASDSEGRTTGVEVTIVVRPRLSIASLRPSVARVGGDYRARISAVGGVGATTYRLVGGRLPAGIRLDARTGVLSGAPHAGGTYRVVIEARDTLGATARRAFVLTVQ
jgi:Putative Ig domain